MKPIENKSSQDMPTTLPVVPTIDVVVFPHMLVPLLVLDERIINGVQRALETSKLILLLATKKQPDDQISIGPDDLYAIGTVASIMRLVKIPEGGVKILVQGVCKARVANLKASDGLEAQVTYVPVQYDSGDTEIVAQVNNIKGIAEKMTSAGQLFSPDFYAILSRMQEPDKIAEFVLSHLNISVEQGQALLEVDSFSEFLSGIYQLLVRELEVAQMQETIKNRARESMNKAQKEFYLREQIRAIKTELGEDEINEIDGLREKLEKINASEEVKAEIKRQLSRLEKTSPDSMEAGVIRNYLEWAVALPWGVFTEDNLDIQHAKEILDEDHYGLADVKERILDFISVRTLKKMEGTSPILCFIGPPGTGKTSLGQSIARSLGRSYIRISLGGVRDEAEIRGHRRTYVGAMPGRFIQALRKAGSSNPVVVIDELDKIGADFRGDPAAAMLEVLDPQQNKAFYDNYLGIPYDLSHCMFIATANSLDTISAPLLDRMEVIELSGYTMDEKCNIARKYLIPRSALDSGLQPHEFQVLDGVVEDLIANYTHEAGVRQLERLLRKLCAKAARALVEESKVVAFAKEGIESYLGPRKFIDDEGAGQDQVGISNGLAWTPCGGELIKIEAVLMPGKGQLLLTGQLGEVMKESAQAAMSYARAHAKEFDITDETFVKNDLHIHVPAGAIPKDGPSAGITILTSILSAFTQRPISGHYAMTGELNLRGEVMPIGGIKEKILAAKRNKIPHIILPQRNKHELAGLDDLIGGIEVIWVHHANEVMERVLLPVERRKAVRHH